MSSFKAGGENFILTFSNSYFVTADYISIEFWQGEESNLILLAVIYGRISGVEQCYEAAPLLFIMLRW